MCQLHPLAVRLLGFSEFTAHVMGVALPGSPGLAITRWMGILSSVSRKAETELGMSCSLRSGGGGSGQTRRRGRLAQW